MADVWCMTDTQSNTTVKWELCGTVTAHSLKDPPVVFFIEEDELSDYTVRVRQGKPGGGKGALIQTDLSGTLGCSNDQTLFADEGNGRHIVRKLTPLECERLQGFPDDWTKIPFRGKDAESCPNTPRYKAIGNSFPVPVVRWIGERIIAFDTLYGDLVEESRQ